MYRSGRQKLTAWTLHVILYVPLAYLNIPLTRIMVTIFGSSMQECPFVCVYVRTSQGVNAIKFVRAHHFYYRLEQIVISREGIPFF